MSRRHAEIDAEIEADPDAEIYTVAERRRRALPRMGCDCPWPCPVLAGLGPFWSGIGASLSARLAFDTGHSLG